MQPRAHSLGIIQTVNPLTVQVSGLTVPAQLRAHALTVAPTVGQTWETHVEGHSYWLDRPVLSSMEEGTVLHGLPDLTLEAGGRLTLEDGNGPILDLSGLLSPRRRCWTA